MPNTPLSELVTIAVSPRERHYSLIPSLVSLFATIPANVRVIVAHGDLPSDLLQSLKDLNQIRTFDLIHENYPLYPQEARNLCLAQIETPYMVVTDNDVEYEAGWLEKFIQQAQATASDIVAPVIFIGPPKSKKIHHAGGILQGKILPNQDITVEEIHRLANRDFNLDELDALNGQTHTIEFHCFLASVAFIKRLGGFDERFITQEQVEFGLRIKALDGKITFAPDVHVTYMAKKEFTQIDLNYMSFRWNDAQALQALEVIENNWSIRFDTAKHLKAWIRPHRLRAYGTRYPQQLKAMGPLAFFDAFMKPIEHHAIEAALLKRNGKQLKGVYPISEPLKSQTVKAFITP
jgi:hypothetical protein